MDVSYDIWTGESIQEIIQTVAKFRLQVFPESDRINQTLSDEINYITHYFDEESIVIVANDCGQFVGYMALVSYSEHHPLLSTYSHYGGLIKISEGPIIHPSYRSMGIGKQLIVESIHELELKDYESLILDTKINIKDNIEPIIFDSVKNIVKDFSFNDISINNNLIYEKKITQ